MSKIKVLRALAEDCREQGEIDIAEGIESVIVTIESLCTSIRAERTAHDRSDTVAYMEARVGATADMVLLVGEQQEGSRRCTCLERGFELDLDCHNVAEPLPADDGLVPLPLEPTEAMKQAAAGIVSSYGAGRVWEVMVKEFLFGKRSDGHYAGFRS